MLYIWTDASMLSDVKMLSFVKDLIPDICGRHLNNLQCRIAQILNQYSYKTHGSIYQILTFDHNIIFTQRHDIGRNVRSVTFVETAKTSHKAPPQVFKHLYCFCFHICSRWITRYHSIGVGGKTTYIYRSDLLINDIYFRSVEIKPFSCRAKYQFSAENHV